MAPFPQTLAVLPRELSSGVVRTIEPLFVVPREIDGHAWERCKCGGGGGSVGCVICRRSEDLSGTLDRELNGEDIGSWFQPEDSEHSGMVWVDSDSMGEVTQPSYGEVGKSTILDLGAQGDAGKAVGGGLPTLTTIGELIINTLTLPTYWAPGWMRGIKREAREVGVVGELGERGGGYWTSIAEEDVDSDYSRGRSLPEVRSLGVIFDSPAEDQREH